MEGTAPESIVQMVSASAGVAMYCIGVIDLIRKGYDRSRALLADNAVAVKFDDFRSTSRSLA
jgi:anthranilate phosphoribosyltransferase